MGTLILGYFCWGRVRWATMGCQVGPAGGNLHTWYLVPGRYTARTQLQFGRATYYLVGLSGGTTVGRGGMSVPSGRKQSGVVCSFFSLSRSAIRAPHGSTPSPTDRPLAPYQNQYEGQKRSSHTHPRDRSPERSPSNQCVVGTGICAGMFCEIFVVFRTYLFVRALLGNR